MEPSKTGTRKGFVSSLRDQVTRERKKVEVLPSLQVPKKEIPLFHSTLPKYLPNIKEKGLSPTVWAASEVRHAVSHAPTSGTVLLRFPHNSTFEEVSESVFKSSERVPPEQLSVVTPRGKHTVPIAEFDADKHTRRPPQVVLSKGQQLALAQKREKTTKK